VARDRKRAKQRQQRQQRDTPSRGQQSPRTEQPLAVEARSTDEPPEVLDEASADAELAKAALARGANDDPFGFPHKGDDLPATLPGDGLEAEDELDDTGRRGERARSGAELSQEGNRFINFLRACWAELQRVQWPNRRQVAQATAVVLGFVVIAGGYLGLADYVFQRLVNAIL
jgi:preprotein translocase SecE subunit